MFPTLTVLLDDETEPHTIEILSTDFWTYEEIAAKSPSKAHNDHAMRCTIAFLHLEGRDPVNLAEVKTWAKNRRARITVGQAANPTQPDPSGD